MKKFIKFLLFLIIVAIVIFLASKNYTANILRKSSTLSTNISQSESPQKNNKESENSNIDTGKDKDHHVTTIIEII